MQLRLISSPRYYLPQRQEAVKGVSARARPAGEGHTQRQAVRRLAHEQGRIPVNAGSDNARHQYNYSRVEAAVGRTAQALKNYTDIEDAAGREQLRDQLGLDVYA